MGRMRGGNHAGNRVVDPTIADDLQCGDIAADVVLPVYNRRQLLFPYDIRKH